MDKIWEAWYVPASHDADEIQERFSSEDKAFRWVEEQPRPQDFYVRGPFHVL